MFNYSRHEELFSRTEWFYKLSVCIYLFYFSFLNIVFTIELSSLIYQSSVLRMISKLVDANPNSYSLNYKS